MFAFIRQRQQTRQAVREYDQLIADLFALTDYRNPSNNPTESLRIVLRILRKPALMTIVNSFILREGRPHDLVIMLARSMHQLKPAEQWELIQELKSRMQLRWCDLVILDDSYRHLRPQLLKGFPALRRHIDQFVLKCLGCRSHLRRLAEEMVGFPQELLNIRELRYLSEQKQLTDVPVEDRNEFINTCRIALEDANDTLQSIELNKEKFPEYQEHKSRLIAAKKKLIDTSKIKLRESSSPLASVGSFSSKQLKTAAAEDDEKKSENLEYRRG